MYLYHFNNYIVKNSSGEILRFYLDNNKRINYEQYAVDYSLIDRCLFSDETILSFSLDMDSKDRIHLIYITNDGNICYNLYSNNGWAKKILTKLDIKSNTYNELSLKISKENIHILLSFCNLINPKVWTIQHYIGSEGNWKKTNVISFTSGKNKPFYTIDIDKFDNLHMLYTSFTDGLNKLYYTYYNTVSNKWSTVPKLLYESHNSIIYPNLLIDKLDNLHVLWADNRKNDWELKYKHLSQSGFNKNIWIEEKLPLSIDKHFFPIIIEETDSLKIYIIENSKIYILVSNNYGFNWKSLTSVSIPEEIKIDLAKTYTNILSTKNIKKIPFSFFYLKDKRIIIQDELLNFLKKCDSIAQEINANNTVEIKNSNNIVDPVDVENDLSNNEKNINETSELLIKVNEISQKIHDINDIFQNIKQLNALNSNCITQLKSIDSTLIALKEVIDINNQHLIDIDKKIDELKKEKAKKRFWSKLFKKS